MSKPKLELDRKSVIEKIALGKQIVLSMTGNTNFPLPAPPLTDITTATNDLETAQTQANAARQASESKTEIQNQKEDDFDKQLTKLANHVEDQSDGDKAKIESSGMESFEPGKAPDITEMLAPENLLGFVGDFQGEIDLD